MSHLIAENYTDLRIDFLNQANYSGGLFTFSLPSTYNTDITATTTSFTLYSGSSYYLEASVLGSTNNQNGAVSWQFYSDTDSNFIGSDASFNVLGGFSGVPRMGRKSCSALVLDADISVTKVISLRTSSLTGTGWTFNVAGFSAHVGYPTIRIMQLPT